MREYMKERAVQVARHTLQLLNVSEEELKQFDGLCEDFGLTVGDVTDWEEEDFSNPQG